jgi:pimeloyl-ACP methyl ester carboxylesterase
MTLYEDPRWNKVITMSFIIKLLLLLSVVSCSSKINKDSRMLVNSYGAGTKTIILLHGGPSFSNYMSTLGTHLSDKYRVVEYSQKGTPENPTSNKEELTLSGHLRDLKAIVDSHKDTPLILIGHSWGASLALLFIAENPRLISKTILIGSAPLEDGASKKFGENIQDRLDQNSKEKLLVIKSLFEEAKTNDEKNVLMQERLRIIGSVYHFDPKTEDNFSELKWDYTSFVTSIDSLWDFIDAGKMTEALQNISDPVVAYHGEFDPIPMEETFIFLKKHIAKLKVSGINKSGHFPWLELAAKKEFLTQLKNELEF